MKKITLLSLAALFLMFPVYAAGLFSVSLTGNYLGPSDGAYKDIYGSSMLYPELKLGYKVFKSFSLWAGFGRLSAEGTTPVLEEEAKSTQDFLSFGVGYNGNFTRQFGYKLELGAVYIKYKEEAMDIELSDSAFGFRADMGFIYRIGKSFFTGVWIGYLSASDTVENVSIKLGGVKGGVGIGFSF